MAVSRALAAGIVLGLAGWLLAAAPAQTAPVTSKCLAVARNLAPVVPVAYREAALEDNE
jgi:hypothetical protein